MKFTINVRDLRQLVDAAGVPVGAVAARMGRSDSMTSLKLKGKRPLFMDEVGPIVAAINEGGSVTVTEEQVVKLVGKANIKLRGFAV